jgi:hypothetical protein
MPRRPLLSTSRLVHVLAVAACVLPVAAATPCAACSCGEAASLADSAARADVVFVGAFVDTSEPAHLLPGLTSSAEEVGRIFEVTEVRKGAASIRTEVRTAASGGSCGLEVEPGGVYVVVATTTPTGLTGGLCDGTRLLTTVTASDLDAVGAAQAPEAGVLTAGPLDATSPLGDRFGSPLALGAGLAAVTVLVALLAMVVVRRRGRGSRPPADTLR